MKTLLEYINEALFRQGTKNEYFYYGSYRYVKLVLKNILDGIPIRLGEKGEDGILPLESLTEKDRKQIEKFLENIVQTTFEDFDELIKQWLPSEYQKKSIWRMLFKGDFSGYTKGLKSKNKGNFFEEYFHENYFKIFEPKLKELGYLDKFAITQDKIDGGNNSKRGIVFGKNKISNRYGKLNVGKIISDITIKDENNNELLYLSLKFGSTTTWANVGVKNIFNPQTISNPDMMPQEGKTIIDMLGLDIEQIQDVFENHKGKYRFSEKEKRVNVIDHLKNNDLFTQFMQNIIGFGYILVHAENDDFSKIGYLDLRSEKTMNELIKGMKEAEIQYGGAGGQAKRIDIIIKYSNMNIKINIRSKDGSVYPTHIMCDYKITNEKFYKH